MIVERKAQRRAEMRPQFGAQATRTLVAVVATHERELLRAAIARERELLAQSLKSQRSESWREFVRKGAAQGDQAAISALRGLRYQEGRDRRLCERDGISSPDGLGDPLMRFLVGIAYRIERGGTVAFYRQGDRTRRELFRDEGPHIAVACRADDRDIAAALRLAAEKWGARVTLSGTAEFQDRTLRIAVQLGLEVANAELAARQRELREARDRGRVVPRSPGIQRPRDRDVGDRDR